MRNTALNATGFFKPLNNEKPVLIQNQFGAAMGGPVVKEKAFFFADYEGFRRVSKRITFATLPTASERLGIFSIPIRNPYTGEIYQNGVIPSNVISPIARDVLSLLPATNLPGTSNNFQSQPRATNNTDKGDARYDHYFSTSLTAFVRYSHRLMENLEPRPFPGSRAGTRTGMFEC